MNAGLIGVAMIAIGLLSLRMEVGEFSASKEFVTRKFRGYRHEGTFVRLQVLPRYLLIGLGAFLVCGYVGSVLL